VCVFYINVLLLNKYNYTHLTRIWNRGYTWYHNKLCSTHSTRVQLGLWSCLFQDGSQVNIRATVVEVTVFLLHL